MVWVKAGEWNMQGTTQEEKMKSDYVIENPPKNGRDITKYLKKLTAQGQQMRTNYLRWNARCSSDFNP